MKFARITLTHMLFISRRICGLLSFAFGLCCSRVGSHTRTQPSMEHARIAHAETHIPLLFRTAVPLPWARTRSSLAKGRGTCSPSSWTHSALGPSSSKSRRREVCVCVWMRVSVRLRQGQALHRSRRACCLCASLSPPVTQSNACVTQAKLFANSTSLMLRPLCASLPPATQTDSRVIQAEVACRKLSIAHATHCNLSCS